MVIAVPTGIQHSRGHAAVVRFFYLVLISLFHTNNFLFYLSLSVLCDNNAFTPSLFSDTSVTATRLLYKTEHCSYISRMYISLPSRSSRRASRSNHSVCLILSPACFLFLWNSSRGTAVHIVSANFSQLCRSHLSSSPSCSSPLSGRRLHSRSTQLSYADTSETTS
jgi:hypothetical protein